MRSPYHYRYAEAMTSQNLCISFKNWFTTINNGVGLCFCVSSVSTFSENTKAIRKRRRYTSYRNNTLMEI